MDHTATMRRTYELISAGDIDGFGDLLAENFVEHQEAPGLPPTKAGVLDLFRGYRAAFPDLRMDAVEVLPSGDRAVARVTVSGTQTGDFMGMPASGRHAEVDLIDIMRFDDAGLVCEHWGVADMLSLLQQLGAIPEAAATS
ncbi:ester cyclase [Intrasporangium sp. YIM S08009]|uniref:ester cyclase n=1 Tax=Intrasporangium zincisolvens TaxID=3080018 RepID=UPI002B05DB44|nr:ester cyclase [Intrasporangium sp. YIM S08009]